MGLIIEIAFVLVLIILAILNIGVRITYKNMRRNPNETNLSGFEVARALTNKLAEEEPHIIKKNGKFLDYYDSNRNVIKLSPEVFDGTDKYAAMIAAGLATLTSKDRANKVRGHNINNFIVMLSYLMIVLGACMNNSNVIYFGMVLFIIAFLIQISLLNIWGKKIEDLQEIYKIIRKEKLIKPFTEEEEIDFTVASLVFLARLPYGFINNFR